MEEPAPKREPQPEPAPARPDLSRLAADLAHEWSSELEAPLLASC